MKIRNPFRNRIQKSIRNLDEMDSNNTDIEPKEEDFYLGFLGRNARMSIASVTNNNIIDFSRKGSKITGLKLGEKYSDSSWKIPIETFSSKLHDIEKKESKKVRSYYKAQNELIETFEDIHMDIDDSMETSFKQERILKSS